MSEDRSGGSTLRRDIDWSGPGETLTLSAGVLAVHPESFLHRHDADCCWDCYASNPAHVPGDHACEAYGCASTQGDRDPVQGSAGTP